MKLKLRSYLYDSSSSTTMVADGVVTSEATGDDTVRDAGETGKEPDDHSGDDGVLTSASNSMSMYTVPSSRSTHVDGAVLS
ncbi:hypothetical protein Tco_0323840 [Tanacetum coccineum]